MGTVYRAELTQPVKRQVALKLIKIGMDSRAVLARFDSQRQALALMDHPNFARVFDGGTTASGQQFFVMELVSGEPITEYCDRLRLPVRARLELFVSKDFKRGAILEMLRMVREVDPPRPSTKLSRAEALPSIAASRDIDPAPLRRALQGDLDWIVMKALEKDRTRRYETANGFAADILRHLAHEPVAAAPPSRAYRVRKFVRNHRGAVISAAGNGITSNSKRAVACSLCTATRARCGAWRRARTVLGSSPGVRTGRRTSGSGGRGSPFLR
jgi:hypothetical protein